MRFGIRQKILLVLVGVLVFTIGLVVLAASYYTDRQNEEAAFADLGGDLRAWRDDLQSSAAQMKKAALAVVEDELVQNQLAEMLSIELQSRDPVAAHELARTLAYTKTVALNRLYLMLRTGPFSSIAVYTRGALSHYVSGSEAGMLVQWQRSNLVWIRASADENGNLPLASWPSWEERGPPTEVAAASAPTTSPTVATLFPTAGSATIEVAVPIEGVMRVFPHWRQGYPAQYLISDLAVSGVASARAAEPAGVHPVPLAAVVFRKLIDRPALEGLARKTGKWPVLLSIDGQHRVAPDGFPLASPDLLQAARSQSVAPSVIQRIVNTGGGSFYATVLPWSVDGRTRLFLGFALSREKTLHNIQQTVTAILLLAGLVLLLSITIGRYWVGRITRPIATLTAAVKNVELGAPSAHARAPVPVATGDEIGELAAAFNTMLAALRESFETLEHRVADRTSELRQQTRYVRTLLDTLPLRACLKDTHGRYLAANEPLARLCGLQRADEMIGKIDLDLWPPEQVRIIQSEDLEVITTKRPKIVEDQVHRGPAETAVWVERFRAPVLDEDGTVLGIVLVSRDIHAQKEAEAARETALAEAVRLARLRSDFLARMSHELRTPLNAILGYAQILQRGADLTERQARGIGIIQSSGEHLLALINDVLHLARIDACKLDLEPAELDLDTFLQSVTDVIRVKAHEKSLLFFYEALELPAAVRVDAKRLRQVLLNLLSNAVKFTDSGNVLLRVQCLSTHEGTSGSVLLRFEVRDSGIGMTREQLERIFQPFEQVADAGRQDAGTGLGLAISQQLVRLMGGEIHVKSESGRGSLFAFELVLPLAAQQAPCVPSGRQAIGYEGQRRSILVADDVEKNRAMLSDILIPLGFEVSDAGDGEEVLAQIERRKPDLILMDIVMPVLDGLEATRRLRLQPHAAHIPVIAVSANATREEAARSRDAGVNAFLAKPIELQALLQLIGEQLRLSWIWEEPRTSPPHS